MRTGWGVGFGRSWMLRTGAALILAVAVAGCGGSSNGQGIFGKFAGYIWSGPTDSMAAKWSVPTIEGTTAGFAGTWIGAEAAGASSSAPFIQVGTNEDRVSRGGVGVNLAGFNPDLYSAFWTDTAHSFVPVALFAVRPGDRITASLALTHGGVWEVRIADVNSHVSRTITTRQEGGAHFDEAEFLQEDVSSRGTQRALPYPQLTDTRFSQMKVDSLKLGITWLAPVWMSIGNGVLAPTLLTRDSFAIKPAVAPPAAIQYRAKANAIDAAEAECVHLSGASVEHATVRATSGGCLRFAAALRSQIRAFGDSDKWSARLRPFLPAIVAASRTELHLVLGSRAAAGEAGWGRLSRSTYPLRRALRPQFQS
jgi:hypothetical protein